MYFSIKEPFHYETVIKKSRFICDLIPVNLSLIHISEPTRQAEISYAVFCLKKKKKNDQLLGAYGYTIRKYKERKNNTT